MTRLALSARRSAVSMFNAGYTVAAIQQQLKDEDVTVTKRSLYRLLKKFKEKGVYTDLPRRARDKKLTQEMLTMINNELEENDEAIVHQGINLGKAFFQTSLLHLYCKHDDIYGFTLYLFVIKK